MAFVANRIDSHKTRDYIMGDPVKNISITVDRWYYLWEIAQNNELTIACRDPETNKWTKWVEFPGILLDIKATGYKREKLSTLAPVIDVHRSILTHEVVVESDYQTYEEN